MADARLAQMEVRENLAGGPDSWEVIIVYWLISAPNDIKRTVVGAVPKDDIASELAAWATANTITWV